MINLRDIINHRAFTGSARTIVLHLRNDKVDYREIYLNGDELGGEFYTALVSRDEEECKTAEYMIALVEDGHPNARFAGLYKITDCIGDCNGGGGYGVDGKYYRYELLIDEVEEAAKFKWRLIVDLKNYAKAR